MDDAPARRPGHFPLFRLFGLEVEAHAALVPLTVLSTVAFATWLLPAQEGADAYSRPAFWALALGATALVLLSETLHEVAHGLVARALGIPVQRVAVFFHAPEPEGFASTAWREIAIAASGPCVTVVLALLAFAGFLAAPESPGLTPLLRTAAVSNLLLATCYLLPALPLDGGRILRALFWGLSGSRLSGARAACWSGRLFALGLVVLGGFRGSAGDMSSAVLLGLFGFVLFIQAGAAWQATRLVERLSGLTASDLMHDATAIVPRVLSVAEALTAAALAGPDSARAFLVEFNGRLGGVVTLSMLRRVPPSERDSTPVGQVTSKLRREHVLSPGTRLESALRRMLATRLPILPVVSEGSLVGVVSRDAILRVAEGEDPRAVRNAPP